MRKIVGKVSRVNSICLASLLLTGYSMSAFADIVLHGNQVISTPVSYNNTTLDMTDARFTINTGGSLAVTNSTVNVTISATNPFWVNLTNGALTLNNDIINVTTSGITQQPNTAALYELIQVQLGALSMLNNTIQIGTPYTVGLLATQNNVTNGFIINNNTISNFHGGLYLTNSNNAQVNNNTFTNVSNANIYNQGNLNTFTSNIFNFPGNFQIGNALSIVNSNGINIKSNIISSSSNEGMSITGGNNIFINDNKITDCESYGIVIQQPSLKSIKSSAVLAPLFHDKNAHFISNDNIIISNNYIGQNRFGLTATAVSDFTVTNNIFIQRFEDSSTRQYWTNNDNLLFGIDSLIWVNNVYKEAFTQVNGGDNSTALKFSEFPAHGGVVIN